MALRKTPAQVRLKIVNNIQLTRSGCWLWRGAKFGNSGYGLSCFNGRCILAHRMAYLVFHGPIPESYYVCHSCDVKLYVNPKHLWAGTAKDNMRDCTKRGRQGDHTPLNPASGDYNGARTKLDRRARGDRHGHSKLHETGIPVIRELAKRQSCRSIGRLYGVAAATISEVARRLNWVHIP